MILLSEQKNQLCNRLFSLLPSMAYSLENDEKMVVLFFSKKYLKLFPKLNKTDKIHFLLCSPGVYPKGFLKFLYLFIRTITKAFTSNRNDFSFLTATTNTNRILIVQGWKDRYAASYIDKHYATITNIFQPAPDVLERVNTAFEYEKPCIIIGVHVRKGDYKNFKGGMFYYDTDIYCSFMKQMQDLLNEDGRKVKFFICSNESVDEEIKSRFHLINLTGSDAITDLCSLSNCDYIIGPPSTFSQWASFMGKVPLKFIAHKEEKIALSDFNYILSIDNFIKTAMEVRL